MGHSSYVLARSPAAEMIDCGAQRQIELRACLLSHAGYHPISLHAGNHIGKRERGMMKTRVIRWGRRLPVLPVMGIAIAFGCNTESESGSSAAGAQRDILVARSVDAGVTWSAPAALNVDATQNLGADEAPQLTTDGLGAWLAVWHATSFEEPIRTDFDVLVSHSANGGARWSDQAELNMTSPQLYKDNSPR